MDKTDAALADVIKKLQDGLSTLPWHDAQALILRATWLEALKWFLVYLTILVIGGVALLVWQKWLWRTTGTKDWDNNPDRSAARGIGLGIPLFAWGCVLIGFFINMDWITLFDPMAALALRVLAKVGI